MGSSFVILSSMRKLTRYSVLWLVLATHLVAFEWGPTLHRWQCLATGASSSAGDCGHCCGANTAGNCSDIELADPHSGQPGSEPVPHDPRHCSICKFFAYSPAAPPAAAVVVRIEAARELHVTHRPLIVETITHGHSARGPPVWS